MRKIIALFLIAAGLASAQETRVTGDGVQDGTRVVSVEDTTITLSKPVRSRWQRSRDKSHKPVHAFLHVLEVGAEYVGAGAVFMLVLLAEGSGGAR